MSDTALQDTPRRSSTDTAEIDLEWLTLEDGESIQWASTPHKYSLVPAFVIGIPLSLVLVGIPLLVGSYLQYTNTNYVVTNRGLYSKPESSRGMSNRSGSTRYRTSPTHSQRWDRRSATAPSMSVRPAGQASNSSFAAFRIRRPCRN